MKTKFLILLAALGLAAASAGAQILYDHNTQSFTNGNLVGQNGWSAHSGAGNLPVQVDTSGTVTLLQGPNSREDVNRKVGAFTPGNTYYAGFILSVGGAETVTNTYFAHFLEGTSTFRSRVWVTADAGGDYTLAFGNGSSIESTWADTLSFNTPYTVVMSFDFDSGNANLWVNPLDINSTSIAATASTSAQSALAFRQAAGDTTQTISNIVVGTNFAQTLAVIPEPGTLALLLLGVGFILRIARRRHSAL